MPRVWYVSIVTALLLLFVTSSRSQDFPSRHYKVLDGLPSNTVYDVYRDSKGFLWITTDKGVARYNGITFENYTTLNGLPDNEVFGCMEDKEGRVWFLSYNGELSFFKDDSFYNARNIPMLAHRHPRSQMEKIFIQDDSSIIFLFHSRGYFCHVTKNGHHCLVLDKKIDPNEWPIYIKSLGKSKYRILIDTAELVVDFAASPQRLLQRRSIRNKTAGKDLVYLLGQNGGFLHDHKAIYGTDYRFIRKLPLNFTLQNRTITLYFDKLHNLFACTNNGLYINDSMNVFGDKTASSITQDISENYWMGTLGDGIYSFSNSFLNAHICVNAYNRKITYAIEIGGRLFFCTDDHSLYTFENGKTSLIYRIQNNQSGSYAFFIDDSLTFYAFGGWMSTVIHNIMADRPQIKNYRCDIRVPSYKSISKADRNFFINARFSISEVNMDDFGSQGAVKFKKIFSAENDRAIHATVSPDNTLWFSTMTKVYKADNGVNVVPGDYKNTLFTNFEFFGKYLVGFTPTNQLLVCRDKQGAFETDSFIKACVWDNLYRLDTNHVLVSSNGPYYILTLDLKDSVKPFMQAVEDPFIPLQADAVCVGKNDCYFFKEGSIIKIRKTELLKKAKPPLLYFTQLKARNKTYKIYDNVSIPYKSTGSVIISVSVLSFLDKGVTCQYTVTKKGSADNWINFTGNINLANRSFGEYTIKVRAKTTSSDFSKPIQFSLTILRPFWASWWFVCLTVCGVVLLVSLIIKKQIRSTITKKEKEHQDHVRFIKSEYKALNALMNPHFIFNSLNNVQSLVNNNDKLNAIEYLAIFADLIRQNMHNISNETISLEKEMNLVKNYLLLEKLRFEDQLNYSINIEDNLFLSEIMVPPLLIQPLVENAIKHGILPLKSLGRQGFIHVNVYEESGMLFVSVKDNGIGIKASKEKRILHRSFGLENLRSRIQQLSIIQGKEISFQLSDLTDSNGKHQGTVATISMPL
jgi:two-component sensor histidine kinase